MKAASNARTLAFVTVMGALGNVMFVISQTIFRTGSIALDLSHIGTFVAAIYGGPLVGLATGFIVGIGPGFYFGYLGASQGLLGLIGLPVGKALTGLTVGYLARILKIGSANRSSWRVTVATLAGYVPEAIFTVIYFEYFVAILLPSVAAYLTPLPFIASLLTKAWIEIGILTAFMVALVGNSGFNEFLRRVFTRPYAPSEARSKQPELNP